MPDITREALASALSRTRIIVEEPRSSSSVHDGPDGWMPVYATGTPKYPDELAGDLLKEIAAQPAPAGPGPDWRSGMQRELDAMRAAYLALIDLPPDGRVIALRWLAYTLERDGAPF